MFGCTVVTALVQCQPLTVVESVLQSHMPLLETSQESRDMLLTGLRYLIQISYVEDIEVFKSCLDFWNYFVCEVYSSSAIQLVGQVGLMYGHSEVKDRVEMYREVLSQLRALMLVRMAKPEEVGCDRDPGGMQVQAPEMNACFFSC